MCYLGNRFHLMSEVQTALYLEVLTLVAFISLVCAYAYCSILCYSDNYVQICGYLAISVTRGVVGTCIPHGVGLHE